MQVIDLIISAYIYIIFIHTCIPTQNAIINLWAEMAKQRYQTTLALPSVPIAMPSNIACREMAKTTINPRKAALKMRKVNTISIDQV